MDRKKRMIVLLVVAIAALAIAGIVSMYLQREEGTMELPPIDQASAPTTDEADEPTTVEAAPTETAPAEAAAPTTAEAVVQ